MTLETFVSTYTGKQVTNNSGNYKGECVSLASRYSQEVLGIPNSDGVLYCQKTGGARDLYESPTALQNTYYDRIPFGQPRKRGDLVIWGENLGQYGDVAIALDGANFVFGQLGTPVFTPANTRNETRQPLGYLRKKGTKMDLDKAKEAVSYMYLATATGDKPEGYATPGQIDYWGKRISENPNTLPELSIALYKHLKNEDMRYKAFNPVGGYPALSKKVKELGTALEIKDKEIKRLNDLLVVRSEDTLLLDESGKWFTKLFNRLFKRS